MKQAVVMGALVTGLVACGSDPPQTPLEPVAEETSSDPSGKADSVDDGDDWDDGSGGGSDDGTSGGHGGAAGAGRAGAAGAAGSAGAAGTPGASGSGGIPAQDGPTIASFAASPPSITQGGTVAFLAVVQDPNGCTDVATAVLADSSGATYGSLAPLDSTGTYGIAVDWGKMNSAKAINFALGGSEARLFEVVVTDTAGHTARQVTTVTLACAGLAACGGQCTDTQSDPGNCGACGRSCFGCFHGACAELSVCVEVNPLVTCRDICASGGKSCAAQCSAHGVQAGGEAYDDHSCSDDAEPVGCDDRWPLGVDSARCCCL